MMMPESFKFEVSSVCLRFLAKTRYINPLLLL